MKQKGKLMMKMRFVGYFVLSCLLFSCNGYDLDERLPENFGTSVYQYLSSHADYTVFTRLIEDLNYKEVLNKTGSKTLFVSADSAFECFFQNNPWQVTSYDDLSLSQKKILFNSSMLNNSYQIAILSSSQGPTEGDCMRRMTSASIYDSVPVIKPEEMPSDNKYWAYYKKNNREIVCMKDMTVAPMIHFVEKFLTMKKITNDDVNFLYNYTIDRQAGDAAVNGKIVIESNVRCANGFIHVLNDVPLPLDNMAENLRHIPAVSQYSNLLERFSAPYYSKAVTDEYNRIYQTAVDSVFQKRYFSERSQGGAGLNITPDNGPVEATLKFDPGWNCFYSSTVASTSTDKALQEDMGVMLVPSDKALDEWWHNGSGQVLKDYYQNWDKVPNNVISKLINNNMLNSFVSSVPSKFYTILNDASNDMGISAADVDSVVLSCNGAIYITNKVFNPTAFSSVSFPALINQSMNIIYWAVEQLEYYAYLNSMDAYYSMFIPTNNGLLEYIDPVSYGQTQTRLFRFRYDATALVEASRVRAGIFNYDMETGILGDSIGEADLSMIKNRLLDILQNHIVINDVESGWEYYKTKNGGVIRVNNAEMGSEGMTVEGTFQIDKGVSIPVTTVYDETPEHNNGEGNGKSYILTQGPILTTQKSIHDILSEHAEFKTFFDLLSGTDILETLHNGQYACGSTNLNVLNNFHYTVYVPTNESLEKLIKDGILPTWETVEIAELSISPEAADSLSKIITNFVKYHIQDNAHYMGEDTTGTYGYYETATIDPVTSKFYRIHLQSVKDDAGFNLNILDNVGSPARHIVKDNHLYNLSAREYLYNSSTAVDATELSTYSFAVIHQIDAPLLYDSPLK